MENIQEKQLSAEEKWEKATLANNFIFYKVMRHHQDACRRLIEMLLNIKIEKFENICIEDKMTKLNDRSYKHFFIRAEASFMKPTAIPIKNNNR